MHFVKITNFGIKFIIIRQLNLVLCGLDLKLHYVIIMT